MGSKLERNENGGHINLRIEIGVALRSEKSLRKALRIEDLKAWEMRKQ